MCRHHRNTVIRYIAKKCRSFLGYYENVNWNFDSNGELYVLNRLASLDFRCILDVGANHGAWALAANRIWPVAQIHAFEIVPATVATLLEKTRETPTIIANDFGLYETEQEIEVIHHPDKDTTSAIAINHRETAGLKLTCRVVTGDSYVTKCNIVRIDFLKLDVEGAEDKVLKGFVETIRQERIAIIQFEYSRRNILSHFLLYDFYRFFEEHNFSVGKIYPNYVDFRRYNPWNENFYLSNFLAVHNEQKRVFDLLS